eukprot:2537569-Rhodomonas_salina.1
MSIESKQSSGGGTKGPTPNFNSIESGASLTQLAGKNKGNNGSFTSVAPVRSAPMPCESKSIMHGFRYTEYVAQG